MRALLVFLLFLFYLFGARWFFVCQILGDCAPPNSEKRPATLQVFDSTVYILTGYDEFAFDPESPWPRISPNNERLLDTLTEYLLQEPHSELLIRGYFEGTEMGLSEGPYENLGLARADMVRRLLVRRGLPEEKIFLDYFYTDSLPPVHPIQFRVGRPGQWSEIRRPEPYRVARMSFSAVNFPVNGDSYRPGLAFEYYVSLLKSFIRDNPVERIHITGHAHREESGMENKELGLDLAKSAEAQLRNLGVELPVVVRSLGDNLPLVPPDAPLAEEKNNRVTFELTLQNE